MNEVGQSFACSSCGSKIPLIDAPTTTCDYCKNEVAVDQELRAKFFQASQEREKAAGQKRQSNELRALGRFAFGYRGKKKSIYGGLAILFAILAAVGILSAGGALNPLLFILPTAFILFVPTFIYQKFSANKYAKALALLPVALEGQGNSEAQCPNCGDVLQFRNNMVTRCRSCNTFSSAPNNIADAITKRLREQTQFQKERVGTEAATVATTGLKIGRGFTFIMLAVGIGFVIIIGIIGIFLSS